MQKTQISCIHIGIAWDFLRLVRYWYWTDDINLNYTEGVKKTFLQISWELRYCTKGSVQRNVGVLNVKTYFKGIFVFLIKKNWLYLNKNAIVPFLWFLYLEYLDGVEGDGPLARELNQEHENKNHKEGVEDWLLENIQEPEFLRSFFLNIIV